MALGEIVAWVALGLALLLGILLIVQTRRLSQLERRFRALMGGGKGSSGDAASLAPLVAKQAQALDSTRGEVEALRQRLDGMVPRVARSVQHVGLVRYNPFQETGGDQSFALALLDKQGDGVVMSSLHTRTNTRFYAKPIKNGSSSLSLSDEEVQALQQAMGERTP
jgi:Protein of unknown function (DUF4446)